MESEKILDKVRKLLKLAGNNPNAEEAALAAAKAQELILRHKLDMASIDVEAEAQEPVQGMFAHDPLEESLAGGKTWRGRLAVILCRQNACCPVKVGQSLRIIGTASNVATVRYLYAYVVLEIERLMRQWVLECGGRVGKTPRNNFRTGAVSGVAERFKELERKVRHEYAGTMALVRVDQEAQRLAAFVETQKLRNGARPHQQYDARGYEAGRAAGRTISFNKQVGGRGGRLALGAGQ